MIVHPIPPFFDENSKILILGSFPSVKSREQGFFYGHPQNRFWKVLAHTFCSKIPITIDEKKDFLSSNGIALWDVIGSCEIKGSSDSSITNAIANDLSIILDSCSINRIFLNGKTAERMYLKHLADKINLKYTCLPSTSPANAAWTFEKLCEAWECIKCASIKQS